jgi:beta-phosphoglucomutase-like phosphatase (HAD superfamily)
MVKAVLCDIDGTLVQSNWLHAAAWRNAFAVADIVVDLEDARRQIGKGGDELIPVFVPWWKRKAIEEPLRAYRQYIFRQDYLHQVKPFPKVVANEHSTYAFASGSSPTLSGTPNRQFHESHILFAGNLSSTYNY